jgi:hypothetical protein
MNVSMDLTMRFTAIGMGVLLALAGCVRVQTDPIRIEPIYIEVTVNHRVQKELDDIFAEIDQASQTTTYTPLDPQN